MAVSAVKLGVIKTLNDGLKWKLAKDNKFPLVLPLPKKGAVFYCHCQVRY